MLCASGFSSQLIAALVALHEQHRDVICRAITSCNSRDTMVLEALARFLNVFMDQYSPEALVSFFGETYHAALLETLLVLNFYEPIRDVLLRIFNDTAATIATLQGATVQVLHQLAPIATAALPALPRTSASTYEHRIANDLPHQKFARMLFTCDLLTDLIHERRSGSLGFFYVHAISSSAELASWLIAAALYDLQTLPTAFANESYTVKVLNSLLQQSQCGCVTKAAFLAASAAAQSDSGDASSESPFTQGSPHEDLPVIWKTFIKELPAFLAVLQLPRERKCHFKTIHVQVIYLMLPILNVSCTAVDAHLMRTRTMECVLDLITRFPAANILHCAISRLFIVALEDAPFMFGKELPAYRAANDPLRLHLLLRGCFDTVLRVFGPDDARLKPPPAFLDISISFDQALTTAQAHSPQLFAAESVAAWHRFRTTVLLPTQQVWEEQYEPPSPPKKSPKRYSVAELFDPASELSLPVQAVPTQAEEADRVSMLQRAIAAATLGDSGSEPSSTDTRAPVRTADDIPTPLAALYNDEEKDMMLNVAAASGPSSPVAARPGLPLA